MPRQLDRLIGQRIDGRYDIIEFLSQGTYGAVYRARHQGLERDVALKVVHDAAPVVHGQRLDREAKLLAAVDHPRVVRVHDGGRLPDGRPFLVEDFVEGVTLSRIVHEEGTLEPSRAAGIVAQLLDGLEAVHALGVVHRDVKPSNIMIVDRDGRDDLRLLDFGIARSAEPAPAEQTYTATGGIIGTPAYMAPEQIEGAAIGPATDVYAAGTVLYQLLAGQPPFERPTVLDTLRAHLEDALPLLPGMVPPPLRAVVEQALARAPGDRFHSAAAMAHALRSSTAEGLGIGDRYEVLDLLGSGSFGTVLLGRHRVLDTRVAIKIGTTSDKDAGARFEREARIMASLSHPGLVSVTDSGVLPDGRLYMIQEWVDGRALEALLEHGPLPVERAVALTIGLLEPLGAAHAAGVVHRDLKPGNIMVEADDTVRVIDFGLARSATADEEALTTMGLFVGTLAYAAPEQSQVPAMGELGPAADLYAVGIVLYEMLAGRRPFAAPSWPELIRQHHSEPLPPLPPHVPPAVAAVVVRATAKAPGDRFPSAAAMIDALGGRPGVEAAPPPADQLGRWPLALLALALVVGAVAWTLAGDDPPEPPDDDVIVRVGAISPQTRVADLERALERCRCDRAYDVLATLDVEAPELGAAWRPQWEARCAGTDRACAEPAR